MKRRRFLSLMGTAALASGLLLTGCGGGEAADDRRIIRTLSRPCLSKAMNGGSVNANTAKRIAAALGVPLEELVESEG